MRMFEYLIENAINGKNDSDRHLITLFSVALATRGKTFIELGVRKGDTTKPLMLAAELNGGVLHSVDIEDNPFAEKTIKNWEFHKIDAVKFLEDWEKSNKPTPDFVYVDDWHSYEHVKKELEILDRIVSPKTVILLHDLMYGNTCPYYHTDLTMKNGQWANGGPYRAVAELDAQFWEFSTLPWSHGLTILRKKYTNRNTT